MSFKGPVKKENDNCAPKDKPIKDPETIELPKINQGPKERVDLLGLLKNMKWEEHKLNTAVCPSTDESEISEPPVATKQIIGHDLMGKKNHTALVKAQLIKNHSNKKNTPETKPNVEKPKINAPKVQINQPGPQKNAAMTKAQIAFSNKNPKKLPSLNVSAKNANANGSKIQPQTQELIDTQNEIAKVQAQLEFFKNNPDYIPETDINDEKPKKTELKPAVQSENQVLIKTQNEITKVQAQLEFLNNNPDYIPETNVNDKKPKKSVLKPAIQSENQVLIDTQSEIAKVQAQLEFLKNNPDYIPETNECIPKTQKKVEFTIPKKNEPEVLNSSKVPLNSKPVTKPPPTKPSNVQTNQADTKRVTVTQRKRHLELLEHESFEDYRLRMLKYNRKRQPSTLDTIAEEESEVFQDGCEEEEDFSEVEEIIEEELNQNKLEVSNEEECETLGEEADTECEEADGEECEEGDEEECEEGDEEECEEGDEEEWEEADEEECEEAADENTELHTAENNISDKSDTHIPAQQKRKLIDLLKKISWGKIEKPSEPVELEEVQSAKCSDNEEESATECVELEESQLAESTDNEEVVESSEIQSDSLKEHDIKFDDLEIQPFGTKKADSVPAKASKEDILTSFFNNESSQEEMVSASEKSSLNIRKLQEELLESNSVATPKPEEVHTKSTSENEPEKSHPSEDESFSSFFEDKPLIKPKQEMQSKPTEPVSDQSKSLSETKTSPKDLPQPNTIESKLEQSNEDEIDSKDLKRQESLIKYNLEQDEKDEAIPEGFKKQSSSIQCNTETDTKTVELPTHKIINVAPCETASKTVSRIMDFELDNSERPTKPNSQYTEVRDFSSDSCTEKEESLKIESVHMSEDSSKGSKQSFICHLYKVKIRIKSISWRGSGNMKAVTLSFYNPFTKENSAVNRKFVLPYFYTADFYCYIPYISPPNMLDSSLAYYPPVIFISKRKSVTELARGVLNLNKERLQHKSNSFYANVPLTTNGKIMGDTMLSVKILDYGPLGDGDDSSNEIIEIVFKETKTKEIKIARPSRFVDKTLQKKRKHLIVEEFSSSGDNTSSDLPPEQLFKKRPFRYKRETKSEGSFLATSSISIRADKTKKQKSFINNCKDIQTDIQETDVVRTKSKSKMIQTETEMDSKYTITTTLQCESKVTQTEATSEQQTVNTPKNEQPKKYKTVETMKESSPITTTAENEHYRRQQITSTGKNKMRTEKPTPSLFTDESVENWKTESVTVEKPKKLNKVGPEPLKHRKLTQVRVEEIFSESEEIKSIKSKRVRSKDSKPLKSKAVVEKVFPNFKQIYPASENAESIELKQNKSSRPRKSKIVKLKAAPKQLDLRIGHRKSTNHKTEALDSTEECTDEETPEAVYKYLEGKRLAELFLKVCTERKPALFNKMTYEEQKLYKCNYVKRLRDALPSDFVTPSIKTKENNSSERLWISHMAAFLDKKKAMSFDGSSSSVDKTDDQVPEIHSEVAASDVLINNPDYHAMNKYYHPELCKADVTTSTSYPYVKPPTAESGAQTSERVIKKFTAQTTQEKLLPLLSKKPKKLASKTSELQAYLVIVDTIPSARNGGEKLINNNVLYEKVRESEKFQDANTKNVKKSSKTTKLLKSTTQQDSYPKQCSSAMPNKNIVKNLQFELEDFVKNIKLEVHVLKHRMQCTPDVQRRKKNSQESADFDRLLNNFTSLVARNEEHDFNDVYSELQQLQDLVYNTFRKFSEEHLENTETEFRKHSKTKQVKHIDNYVSQDKELKLIFKNSKMDQSPKRRSHGNKSFKAQSLPNIKSIATLPSEADISDFETALPFYTKFKNRFFKVPSKNKDVLNSKDSESTLTPLGEKSKNAVSMLSLHTGEPIEIETSQMEAIKEKMTTVQIKLRCYLHEREVLNSNNENNPTATRVLKNILILLHEWRRLKAYVEQLYQL